MVDILDLRHSSKVLLFLLENGQIKKTDLLKVISSSDSLSGSLRIMENEGLIKIETRVMGRKTIFINLTDLGKAVAEQLKRAEVILKGKKLLDTDKYSLILYLYRNGPKNLKEINNELPGSTEILRVLEGLKVIKQEINTSKYSQDTIISLTEKGERIGSTLNKVEDQNLKGEQ